jgi:reactive intermediate/imine deaminase
MKRFAPYLACLISIAAVAAGGQSARQIVRAGRQADLPFSPAVKAGNLIYLSGQLPTDDAGKVIAGDIRVQTRRALDNLARVLEAAGSGLDRAVTVHVYLKNAADFPAMNEVYQSYWPKDPPARTTVAANPMVPEALIEVSAVAVSPGSERRVIHPPGWARSAAPYSYGILSGDTLFLAGLLSRSGKDNSVVAGDIRVQTRTAMENGAEILKAAGMSFADVVASRVFITDVSDFQGMNEVYRSYFPKDPPARATVRAGLMGPQYLVEVTMTAVRGGGRTVYTTPNADGSPGKPNPNLSSAVLAGGRLFVSGMMGNMPGNESDMAAQTRETLARIGRTLRAAGFDWGDVVDSMVYVTDAAKFAAMNAAYREVFRGDFPARTTVEAGLVNPAGLVEIMVTAAR